MKFFAPLVVGVLAFVSLEVDANGVCYDPNHGTGMDASSVQADMKTIADHGFDSVRTFISKFGNTEMGPIIAAAGLKAMLGVPYPQSDYQEQMAAAIKAAQAGGVYAIMVGNENLAGASSVPGDMISIIQQIKSQVPEGVLVGSVQRNTEVINHNTVAGWSDLVDKCDLIGMNAHPYFTPGTTADTAIEVLKNQWQTAVGTLGDKLILTETGWPSSGTLMGNYGSVDGAEKFYNAYQQWSSSLSEKFYFQMFDTPYRSEDYEQTFGVVTSNAQDKFSFSAQVSISVGGNSNQVSVSIGGNSNQDQQQQNNQNQQQQNGSNQDQQQQQSTEVPTQAPTQAPTEAPTQAPTEAPTQAPTEAPTQAPTEAPTQVPTEAPTQAPTEAPTQAPTEAPTQAPTEAPTQAPTEAPTQPPATEVPVTEAPTAVPTPEATPVPVETPAIYQSSGSADNNSTSSGSVQQEEPKKSGKTGVQQAEETTQQTTQDAATITGTNAQPQQQDNVQKVNTQSSGTGASTTVVFAIAGAACAAMVAFGFIYQARKRAAQLETAEGKHEGFAVTPMNNHCAL